MHRIYLGRYSKNEEINAGNTTAYEWVFWAKKFRPTFFYLTISVRIVSASLPLPMSILDILAAHHVSGL